ncbi:MAG: acyl-CoA dehydrogenase family protein [Acetobacteraceae bacterium]
MRRLAYKPACGGRAALWFARSRPAPPARHALRPHTGPARLAPPRPPACETGIAPHVRGYSRDWPLERMARDARMFNIGGGTARVLRTLIAGRLLGWKLPQTREGFIRR